MFFKYFLTELLIKNVKRQKKGKNAYNHDIEGVSVSNNMMIKKLLLLRNAKYEKIFKVKLEWSLTLFVVVAGATLAIQYYSRDRIGHL